MSGSAALTAPDQTPPAPDDNTNEVIFPSKGAGVKFWPNEDMSPDVGEQKANKPTPESFEYKDPTNKKVLGPSTWMAQPSAAKNKAINDALDNSPAKAALEENQKRGDTHRVVTAMSVAAQRQCLKTWPLPVPPGPRRMVVLLDVEKRPDRARIKKVTLNNVVGIKSSQFLSCVTNALHDATVDVKTPMWMTTSVPIAF